MSINNIDDFNSIVRLLLERSGESIRGVAVACGLKHETIRRARVGDVKLSTALRILQHFNYYVDATLESPLLKNLLQ